MPIVTRRPASDAHRQSVAPEPRARDQHRDAPRAGAAPAAGRRLLRTFVLAIVAMGLLGYWLTVEMGLGRRELAGHVLAILLLLGSVVVLGMGFGTVLWLVRRAFERRR